MSFHVVIAVRGGPDAKSRLAARLDALGREALVEAMLVDMLTAAAESRLVRRAYVSTPTPSLAELAVRLGAIAMPERASGDLNAAFEAARRRIAAADPDAVVALLPGDLPRLSARELDSGLQAASLGRAVLVPALADGGTGAVIAPARLPLPLAFGPGSFEKHLAAAAILGLSVEVAPAPSLGFDLDRPSDLDAYLALGGGGRTAQALRVGCARETAA